MMTLMATVTRTTITVMMTMVMMMMTKYKKSQSSRVDNFIPTFTSIVGTGTSLRFTILFIVTSGRLKGPKRQQWNKIVKVTRAAQQCYEITQSKLSPALSLLHFKFTYVLESDAKKKGFNLVYLHWMAVLSCGFSFLLEIWFILNWS